MYFHKGDILTVLEYTQGEHWWNASLNGKTGLIPATLVRRLKPNEYPPISTTSKRESTPQVIEDNVAADEETEGDDDSMLCPFNARVVEDYTPSPYETSHIVLKKGQLVTVLDMKPNGKWFGQINTSDGKVEFGKKGLFPFNRVEIIKN